MRPGKRGGLRVLPRPGASREAAYGPHFFSTYSPSGASAILPLGSNPLLRPPIEPTADLTDFDSPAVLRRSTMKAELRDARRAKTAAEAIGPISREIEIYGFTKGQFSIVDVVNHVLDQIGPARLDLCTWTAANNHITKVLQLVDAGRIIASRWLVDLTFNRRAPQLAHRIREVFGDDAIRVAQNHAKFLLLGNDEWKVVIRTSMNLNFNPRFENFQLAHDPELYRFHTQILDEVWRLQPRSLQDAARIATIRQHFNAQL